MIDKANEDIDERRGGTALAVANPIDNSRDAGEVVRRNEDKVRAEDTHCAISCSGAGDREWIAIHVAIIDQWTDGYGSVFWGPSNIIQSNGRIIDWRHS